MRTYRPAASVCVIAVFLVVANLVFLQLLPSEARTGSAADEAWLVYFAIVYEPVAPETLDTNGLSRLLVALHPDSEAVADRFSVISYSGGGGGDFTLEVEHLDGSRFRITRAGVDGA